MITPRSATRRAGLAIALAAAITWTPAIVSTPAHAGLIGFYSFDDAGNPLTDDSGSSKTLTSAGADPTHQPAGGFEAGAYEFDGTQRLIVPIDINTSALPALTLGAWVRTSDINPGLRKIMGHDNGAWDRTIGLDDREPNGEFRYTAFVGNGPPVAGTPAPANTDDWTFIAATFDQPGNQTVVYVDLDASTTADAPVATNAVSDHNAGFTTMAIGGLRPDNNAEGWVGFIDNVFLYDEVLSAEQIAAIRDGGKTRLLTPFPESPPSEALIGFYSFDDAGDPFADASSAGSDLTSAGADPAYQAAGGFQGGGYTFDGNQRLVSPIDISPGVLPQLTVGAWVRPSSIDPGLRKILGHDDGGWDRTIGLDNRDTNILRYTTFVGNGPPLPGTPSPVNTTDWTFIAAAYDQPNNRVTLYIDLDASSTADPFSITSATTGFGAGFNTLTIGNLRPDNNSEGWQGAIDNVFLYNTLLSPGQIAAIRDGGASAILSVDDPNFEVSTSTPLGLLDQDPGATAFSIPVKNGGATQTLFINAPVLGGPDAGHYTISTYPNQLAPGATGSIDGVFDPDGQTGAFAATLTLQSTDANDPLIEVDLSADVPRGVDGLFAFYSFDNPADPFRDDSLSGNDLQSAGADPTYNSAGGIQGGAFEFNGTQRLVAPMNINPGVVPELTLGAWVRTSTLDPGLRKVIGHDDGGWDRTIGLDDREGGFRYTAFIGNGPPAPGTPGPVSTEDWTFLAVAYDQPNNEVTIYVDNELVSVEPLTGVTVPTGMGNGNTTVAIGGLSPVNANEGWQGDLDNVFFVSRILSAEELGDIRSLGRDGLLLPERIPSERLIGFYPFDDEGDPLADASTAGNDLLDGLDGGAANPVWGADTGFQGGAFSFNGSQRLEMPVDINPDVLPELTLGAWVKTSSLASGLRKIMGHDDGGWDRTIGLDNREAGLRYSAFTGTHPLVGTPGPVNTEDWTFIAVAYDNPANLVTVYLDLDASTVGDALVSVSEPTAMGTGQASVAIGGLRPDNNNEGWEGLIDNPFFFDAVLTLEQVTLVRNAGTPQPSEGDDPNLQVVSVPDLSNLGTLPPVHDLTGSIRNDGTSQNLVVDSLSLTGEDAAFFEILTPSLNLAPGAAGDIDLRFDPQGQSGSFRAQLLIGSNDPSEPETVLGLNATVQSTTSLIGLYPFDNAAAPLNDVSGLGNHLVGGQDGGAADPLHEPGDGFEGGSFSFNGLQRLVAPVNVNPGTVPQLTLGAWVRTDSIESGLRKVMGHDDGGWDRTIGLDNRQPDGDFRYSAFVGNGPPLAGTPGPVNTTDWTFLAAVYDNPANTVTVYLDLEASSTADDLIAVTSPTGMGTGHNQFSIGSLRPDNNAEGWAGNIDNAFLVQGAMNAAGMRAVRDGGIDALSGLVADPVLMTPSQSPFGDLGLVQDPVSRMVTISNTGAAETLEITRISLLGPDAGLYSLGAFPASLAPGASGDIEVTFDSAGDSGSFFAELEIISNDSSGRRRNVSLAANVQPSNIADVLMGYYTFDDPDNPFQDTSGNGNDLTAPAGAEPAYLAEGGIEGGVFEFTGGTRLTAPLDINPDVLPAVTFGAWVKTASLDSGLRKVIGHDNGAWDRVIGLDNRSLAPGGNLPDGTLRYSVFPGDNGLGPSQGDPAPEPTSLDDWTFIAAVYDDPGQTVTLYVDLDVSTTDDPLMTVVAPTAMGRGNATTSIGSLRPDNANEGWVGLIDNAFFFETLVSEETLTEMRDFGGLPPSDDPNLRLPRGLVFGNLGSNPGNLTRSIMSTNTGPTQTLDITNIQITGPDAASYSVDSFPDTIPPASTGSIDVRLNPGNRTGGFVAFLEITSNDESDPLQTLDLSARIDTGNGLIAHHRLDDTEGDAMLDSSGNGRHGRYRTNGGSFLLEQSPLADGFAVALDDGASGDDSTAGYGDISSSSLPELSSFSASLWINQDASDPGVSSIFARGRTAGDPFALVTTAGSLIWFSGGTQGLQVDSTVTPGTPQHIVAVYEAGEESGTVTLYVDGVEVATQPGVAPVDDNGSTPLQIGAIDGAFGFTGIVDDFQLYGVALTPEQVAHLFENPGDEVPGSGPPVGVDSDGDGASDASEAIAGTDPNDPSDFLGAENAERTPAGFEFSWRSKAGKTYEIDHTPTLESDDWTVIGSVNGVDGVSSFIDTDAGRLSNPEGHYRARVQQ